MPSLSYVTDKDPGISRCGRGRGFQYFLPNRATVIDKTELERIKGIGVPPAYTGVWICLNPNGHIQATGFDAAGRKQYRYHAQWTEFRSRKKFEYLSEFAGLLPGLRQKVATLLRRGEKSGDFTKEIAIAAVVRLMDQTAMRVGGRSATSKGATTLNMANIRYTDDELRLRYKAKGGKPVQCALKDSALQRILEQIDDLPGKRLFQYIGLDGNVHPLNSNDVNQWLKEATGTEFVSAKMFRTWHGSVAALEAIRTAKKPSIKIASLSAAKRLRNTPTICRKSYIHPAVLELVRLSEVDRCKKLQAKSDQTGRLRSVEKRLVRIIA
jgi:DNA topoisomerase-1